MLASFLGHLTIGFCWWDILSLAILIASVVFVVIRKRSLNRELDELKGAKTN